jgi:trimeric autotransporter adhesin
MNAKTSTTKRAGRAALAASMLIGSLIVGALDGGAVHAAVVYDGSSPSQAAASCWEIKQVAPDSTSGAYWLLTPALQAPQQFYCDQETNGGGWVLIGKGREGWQEYYNGQGNPATLLNPPTPRTPSYFNTVQLPASTVDDLLDHRHVRDLTDGIRLLRARNSTGTEWQEVRMRLSARDRFVWTFGAIHPMQNYGFDGSNTNGGRTNNFGNDSTWRRVTFSELQQPELDHGLRLRNLVYRWLDRSRQLPLLGTLHRQFFTAIHRGLPPAAFDADRSELDSDPRRGHGQVRTTRHRKQLRSSW